MDQVLSVLELMGLKVVSARGKRVGRVVDVIFAPKQTRVVGLLVERPRILLLFDRKDRHLALDGCRVEGKQVNVTGTADAWDRPAARRLGISWDEAVIWVGMPVRAKGGEALGSVRDALFDPETGEVRALGLTGGITADLALGVRDLPARLVEGFDGSAVVVSDEALNVDASGGAAEAAGKGAAIAKKAGGDAARKAIDAGRTAAVFGASAVRVAAKSEAGKKAAGWLKSLKDEVVDAMGDPDDE